MNGGRFFIDTNIFVYSFDSSAPEKQSRAGALIEQALRSKEGVISYQVIQEFLNVAMKKFAAPFSNWDAEQYTSEVFRRLNTIQSSHALFAEALEIKANFGFSWYDSLIVAAAISANCSYLYSEDLKHKQRIRGVTIKNPFAA